MGTSDKKEITISTNKLRQILIDYFDESELQNLAFDLGVDYENLPGQSKGDKARGLIAFLERRGRLSELVQACHQLRLNAPWEGELAQEAQQTSDMLRVSSTSQMVEWRRDNFAHYEIGLASLLTQIGQGHSRYVEGLGYQTRLKENIDGARHHGDSETRRSERSEIIGQLNNLALSVLGKSFNELCSLETSPSKSSPLTSVHVKGTQLYQRIRKALNECEEFDTQGSLTTFFDFPDLRPWKLSLVDASNKNMRVMHTMGLLSESKRKDGRNGLVILLELLRDVHSQELALHHELDYLARCWASHQGG